MRASLEKLARLEARFGVGLPEEITVHLNAGYDSAITRELLNEFGCKGVVSKKVPPPKPAPAAS